MFWSASYLASSFATPFLPASIPSILSTVRSSFPSSVPDLFLSAFLKTSSALAAIAAMCAPAPTGATVTGSAGSKVHSNTSDVNSARSSFPSAATLTPSARTWAVSYLASASRTCFFVWSMPSSLSAPRSSFTSILPDLSLSALRKAWPAFSAIASNGGAADGPGSPARSRVSFSVMRVERGGRGAVLGIAGAIAPLFGAERAALRVE